MRGLSIFSITKVFALVAGGWIALSALVMVLTNAAPAALVLSPTSQIMDNLPEGVAVIGVTPVSVTLKSEHPDLARQLYKAGALLVLPAGLTGCLRPPSDFVQSV